jgi:NTE family protein
MIKFLFNSSSRTYDSVSLSLSGGGARGSVHIGVLQALYENNIRVDAIAGTSIGSIIGAFYCAGIAPLRMKEIMKAQSFTRIFHFSWSKKGLMKMEALCDILKEHIPENSFESLKIPLFVGVSNLDKGVFEIIDRGELFRTVAASASIPVVFEPVEINGSNYVDGGLFNNMPVDPLTGKDSYVVGIHVNNFKPAEVLNLITVAERVFTLVILKNTEESFKKCDYVINPFLDKDYGMLDFKEADSLFDIGYKAGTAFVEKFKTMK